MTIWTGLRTIQPMRRSLPIWTKRGPPGTGDRVVRARQHVTHVTIRP
jgi:hypothetical protein